MERQTQKPAETNQVADLLPGGEFVALVVAKVEFHLRAGHFPLAVRVLEAAAIEWQEETAAVTRRQIRTEAQWLAASLIDLDLPVRVANAFEEAGCRTIREVLTRCNDGPLPDNIGPLSIDAVWGKARQLGIKLERKYTAEEQKKTVKQKFYQENYFGKQNS